VPARTIEGWEQNKKIDVARRVLLTVIEKDPEAVERALAANSTLRSNSLSERKESHQGGTESTGIKKGALCAQNFLHAFRASVVNLRPTALPSAQG
jgi:hypothetical protein